MEKYDNFGSISCFSQSHYVFQPRLIPTNVTQGMDIDSFTRGGGGGLCGPKQRRTRKCDSTPGKKALVSDHPLVLLTHTSLCPWGTSLKQ